ncbi:hypothetical protein Pen01_26130 [Phytomonospora endophytica]|nr:hypothetical protein Pen01_26130 [Phytomonospora endophytica]
MERARKGRENREGGDEGLPGASGDVFSPWPSRFGATAVSVALVALSPVVAGGAGTAGGGASSAITVMTQGCNFKGG